MTSNSSKSPQFPKGAIVRLKDLCGEKNELNGRTGEVRGLNGGDRWIRLKHSGREEIFDISNLANEWTADEWADWHREKFTSTSEKKGIDGPGWRHHLNDTPSTIIMDTPMSHASVGWGGMAPVAAIAGATQTNTGWGEMSPGVTLYDMRDGTNSNITGNNDGNRRLISMWSSEGLDREQILAAFNKGLHQQRKKHADYKKPEGEPQKCDRCYTPSLYAYEVGEEPTPQVLTPPDVLHIVRHIGYICPNCRKESVERDDSNIWEWRLQQFDAKVNNEGGNHWGPLKGQEKELGVRLMDFKKRASFWNRASQPSWSLS